MTPHYRRIIAGIGAGFAILATVFLICYFFFPDFWGGALGVVSVFCYIITFAVFCLIRLNDRKEKEEKGGFKYVPSENKDKNESETPQQDDNKDEK